LGPISSSDGVGLFFVGGHFQQTNEGEKTMKDLNELRHKRGQLLKQCRDLNDAAGKEKRSFSTEEQTKYDGLFNEASSLDVEVKREESLRDAERTLSDSLRHVPATSLDTPDARKDSEKRYQEVVRPLISKVFSRGAKELNGEEVRALQADLNVSGGYLKMPVQFIRALIKGVDDILFVRRLATVQTLTESDSMGVPSLDANPADAVWTGEITTASEDSTMAFGTRELKPHPLKKLIKVSNKLLRLTPDAESLVRDRLAYITGRVQELT
jgi:HK97 family phage major capsid protein